MSKREIPEKLSEQERKYEALGIVKTPEGEWMPCSYGSGLKSQLEPCWEESKWSIVGDPYCQKHTDEYVQGELNR
ncbi:MAG: hypothetical protein A3F94_00505 [Candidatus Spechtbacteria bacterium RIFCSPLOWO2_12_FULL_38_22]|uniref:Uncharacterized protein n=1 Tax=Candidatus Spechtbacteria bacterium RIFCSPLOWO2_12_FULL_38_22 TaxID=1802165 RepID=A0A1G2HGP0_9BACT|nr:MAG: hypothetical protein A2728_00690 [Candidatus Spechtbacteria bacterium RIFCSPHIGHO2_01_FULL_38_11]OGZ59508.1 MAG: hypothetical protein A3E58_02430 [Candidatus Spechtbacteria bacterium RIFCSPHIGHO2_12_FULL_38_30]OGZ59809.1 MAG: hypothetical protein A3A00_00135 [Candidatus Spechtbacteria bacterium RIFCSPLOWO2_01_FULL_38_20]OGZ61421.1 MAG: hypothetical protein A3F94_00505 [Candidatus Spechtbacteria bacterium RIFCSPLOWO2_12_FULL_38_22]